MLKGQKEEEKKTRIGLKSCCANKKFLLKPNGLTVTTWNIHPQKSS